MSFYPLDSAGAGHQSFTVAEEGETGTGGVAAEDIALLEFSNQTLAVGVDSPLELEVGEKL